MTQMIAIFLGVLGLALLLSFPFAWLVMLLWNFLASGVFAAYGIPVLAFWDAWCLYILCAFLFRSTSTSTPRK